MSLLGLSDLLYRIALAFDIGVPLLAIAWRGWRPLADTLDPWLGGFTLLVSFAVPFALALAASLLRGRSGMAWTLGGGRMLLLALAPPVFLLGTRFHT